MTLFVVNDSVEFKTVFVPPQGGGMEIYMLDKNANINKDELDTQRPVNSPTDGSEAAQHEDFDELDQFVPRKPEPHTWPVSSKKFYLSGKDKVYITVLLGLISLFAVITVCVFIWANTNSVSVSGRPSVGSDAATTEADTLEGEETLAGVVDFVPAGISADAKEIAAEDLKSTNAVFLDVSSMTVTASRLADERTYPASLTKVMTLIVVVENLRGTSALNDTITVSEEVYKQMQKAGSSGAGLEPGEMLSVESMLYALMLKSDGIAACELAKYTAGTEEKFVEMMNETAARIGMEDTHFTNSTGLHDADHYSTCQDLANMMAYAMRIDLCKKVMTEDLFVAPCTQASGKQFSYQFYHSLLVTQFDKFNKTSPDGADVIAGKTGYTDESGYCLITYAQNAKGGYIVVTTGAATYADCISDYISIYEENMP